MKAQQLKNSILQLAVQGKLVPQDPNDEPASALLERIRAEKQRLIKEGKIKKGKNESVIFRAPKEGCESTDNMPYAFYERTPDGTVRDITDELPFDVPESWEWVRLGNISANIHYGYTASAQPTGTTKLLRITDIQDNFVNWPDVPFCDTSEKEFETYGLQNKDIMIARTGGTIGKSYIVRDLSVKAVFASYLIRVIPLESVDEEYIKTFLESPFYWEQLKNYSMGTGQPNVNGQSLKSLILPLPPLAEQRRIVERIEQLLPHIADYADAEQKLTALNAAFPDQLNASAPSVSGLSAREKSSAASRRASFSEGIIPIMRSWATLSVVLTMRYRLICRIIGRGRGWEALAYSCVAPASSAAKHATQAFHVSAMEKFTQPTILLCHAQCRSLIGI